MITIESKGSLRKTAAFLRKLQKLDLKTVLAKYGDEGVNALRAATPVNTGLASSSWDYKVGMTSSGFSITWTNTDVERGFPVAIMLQYGYSTGTGGYVHGIDYINPAMKPIFENIKQSVWKEVTSA